MRILLAVGAFTVALLPTGAQADDSSGLLAARFEPVTYVASSSVDASTIRQLDHLGWTVRNVSPRPTSVTRGGVLASSQRPSWTVLTVALVRATTRRTGESYVDVAGREQVHPMVDHRVVWLVVSRTYAAPVPYGGPGQAPAIQHKGWIHSQWLVDATTGRPITGMDD